MNVFLFFTIRNIVADGVAASSFVDEKDRISSAGRVKNEIILMGGCKDHLLLKLNRLGVSVCFYDLFLRYIEDVVKGPTTYDPEGVFLENKEIFGAPTASVVHAKFHFISGNQANNFQAGS